MLCAPLLKAHYTTNALTSVLIVVVSLAIYQTVPSIYDSIGIFLTLGGLELLACMFDCFRPLWRSPGFRSFPDSPP